MKNLYLITAWLFFTYAYSQCPSGTITISSQSQIDSFTATYPGCTGVNGNIFISGNNISSLEGLSQITTVGGQLTVYLCPNLTNLNGLQNISTINTVSIQNNNNLTSLAGLQGLTTLSYVLGIVGNPLINNLNGLQQLTSVGGYINISGNGITSVEGLNNLQTIGSRLDMENNYNLTSLSAFMNLTSIGGSILIKNSPLLQTLSGLDNINPQTIDTVNISNCTSLSFCSVASICNFLLNIGGGTFANNLPGCNNGTEISNVCNLGTEDLNAGKFAVTPNPTTDFLYITASDNAQATNFIVSDLSGKIILDAQNRDNKIDVSHLSNGLYILSIIGDRATSKIKFVKK